MAAVEIRLLGPPGAVVDGRSVDLGGPQPRVLLAMLALAVGQQRSTDRLIDALWPDEPPPRARTTVQTYVSRLRRVLGAGRLLTVSDGYVLALDPDEVDALRFEHLVGEALRARADGDVDGARSSLRTALALWRGPALGGPPADSPVAPDALRLERMRLTALEARADADLAAGEVALVVDELEVLCRQHPDRERLHELLMLGLYRVGRQADALAAYRRLAAALADEHGIEPGPALRALHLSVLRQAPGLAASRPHVVGALPTPPTPTVGRAALVDAVAGELEAHSVLTLTGPGGCGKTRVAVDVARRVASTSDRTAVLVELGHLDRADRVAREIARVLGVAVGPGDVLMDAVVDALDGQRHLLVLDSCEHVLAGAAAAAERLRATCPEVRVLSTSRRPLGITGEAVVPVPPLPVPPSGAPLAVVARSPAVQLFMQRASAADPTLRLDPDTAAAIVRVCTELDGLPLAIELAAARTAALSPTQLADRLGDTFRVLGANHGLTERHRTLRATVAWSHGLLQPDEQVLFRRLAAFAGTFGLDAAEAVAGVAPLPVEAVAGLLADLVDQSVVAVAVRGSAVRYRMLNTVRHHGLEQLVAADEVAMVHRRIAAHLAELTDAAFRGLGTAADGRWRTLLATESANLSAAVEWVLSAGEAELACRLAGSCWWFWLRGGQPVEGHAWLERVDAISADVPPAVRASVLAGLALYAAADLEHEAAVPRAHAALEAFTTATDQVGIALAQTILAWSHHPEDPAAAAAGLEAATTALHRAGDLAGTGTALCLLAHVRRHQGDGEVADTLFRRALRTFDALGDPWGSGWARFGLALCAIDRGGGDLDQAGDLLTQSLAASQAIRHVYGIAHATAALGLLAERRGDRTTALHLLEASVALSGERGRDGPALIAEETAAALERRHWEAPAPHGC